jgi:two-component system chemotaxis response regulator CheB
MVKVARGPKENRHRPSIDVLFRSAATSYGPRVVGVILSGMLDDGSAGLAEIRTRGGVGIVQDAKDALFPDMPLNALAQAGADYQAPRSRLAAVLSKAVMDPMNNMDPINNEVLGEVRKLTGEGEAFEVSKRIHDQESGAPSNFSCPDCGGVLRQLEDNKMLRFRCRVGHALSSPSLLAAQSDNVEQALWSALRALEEKAELAQKMNEYSLSRGLKMAAPNFEKDAKKLAADADVVRGLLKHTEGSEAS